MQFVSILHWPTSDEIDLCMQTCSGNFKTLAPRTTPAFDLKWTVMGWLEERYAALLEQWHECHSSGKPAHMSPERNPGLARIGEKAAHELQQQPQTQNDKCR